MHSDIDLRSQAQLDAEAEQKKEQDRMREDWQHCLKQPQFLRILSGLLTDLGFLTMLYQKSANIYGATATHDAATRIMMDVAEADPAAFRELMQLEMQKRRQQEQ